METSQLKKHIVHLVEESENNRLLEMVYAILEQDFQHETPIWDKLTEGDKTAIKTALEQSERREGIRHEEVVRKFKSKYGYPQ
jgi:hypothetical protein